MDYFGILVTKAGVIGWILWLLSIVTVAIMVQYFIAIRRESILPEIIKAKLNQLLSAERYRDVLDLTEQDDSFLSYIVRASLAEAVHGFPAMERAMEEAAEERTTRLLRHIEWLNLIGNISPMLGLLGTVWGMINAFFHVMNAGGTPAPGQLAGSIGMALVTTLLGLAIAIPSLAVYSVMRNRIDALTSEAMLVSQSMLANFRKPPAVKPLTDQPSAGLPSAGLPPAGLPPVQPPRA